MSRKSDPTLKVFIGGLSGDVKKQELLSYLETFGKIEELALLSSKKKGNNFCIGYAYAVTTLETKEVLLAEEHFFEGRKIQIRPYKIGTDLQASVQENQSLKLYIGNLPKVFTDEQLAQYFSEFGPIQSCYSIRNKEDGSSRRFGFVVFLDQKSVQMVEQRQHRFQGYLLQVSKFLNKKEQKAEPKKGNFGLNLTQMSVGNEKTDCSGTLIPRQKQQFQNSHLPMNRPAQIPQIVQKSPILAHFCYVSPQQATGYADRTKFWFQNNCQDDCSQCHVNYSSNYKVNYYYK